MLNSPSSLVWHTRSCGLPGREYEMRAPGTGLTRIAGQHNTRNRYRGWGGQFQFQAGVRQDLLGSIVITQTIECRVIN